MSNASIQQTAQLLGRTPDQRFERLMPGYTDRLQAKRIETKPPQSSWAFKIIAIKIGVFLVFAAIILYAAAVFYGGFVAKDGRSNSTQLQQITIGSDVLTLPENLIRFSNQRNHPNLERLDLFAHWPSMNGYNDKYASDFDSVDEVVPILFISLEPRQMSKDMSGRVSSIYTKFFSGPPVDAGNGLVRRAFSTQSAFFSEDLYYEDDSPYPFAARCMRENEVTAERYCIRDIHVGTDLSLTYRFHASLLPAWLTMDRVIRDQFLEYLGG